MILANTEIHLATSRAVEFKTDIEEKLTSFDIKTTLEPESFGPSQPDNRPHIWIVLLKNIQQLKTFSPRYTSINEAILFLLCDAEIDNSTIHSTAWLDPTQFIDLSSDLEQALSTCEQSILQKNPQMALCNKNGLLNDMNFLGQSAAFKRLIKRIELVAKGNDTVLIEGATGSGKELTARAIHYLSQRCGGPFIPINCGGFNDDLILSELFGHEKGSFTGADKSTHGLLELADGGTIFLDEVDSLSSKAQVAMLRYLQDQEIRKVGGHKIKRVDVRVLSASNRSIKQLVKKGLFREDLMYRLDVLNITLPALKKRQADLLLLSQFFLAKLAVQHNDNVMVFSKATMDGMIAYDWPGNIRELENFVKRAYLMNIGKIIHRPFIWQSFDELEEGEDQTSSHCAKVLDTFQNEKHIIVSKFEKDYLHRILLSNKGNVSRAASMANKERRAFCRLMQKYGLQREQYNTK
ncbi:MAG: DNA-binding NtrC family response regulator [Paraglaciecola sp.]|jgi:DNA-binding NtrC family response regulator